MKQRGYRKPQRIAGLEHLIARGVERSRRPPWPTCAPGY